MMYYTIVLSGENIFFEHDISPEPIIGFVTARTVEADTEELAIAIAKRDTLVHWNHSFNADRKTGMPLLQIEHTFTFESWLKPKSKHDFYWFTDSEDKQEQLTKFSQPAKSSFWSK